VSIRDIHSAVEPAPRTRGQPVGDLRRHVPGCERRSRENLQQKTSISLLMIALWPMFFGTLVPAFGWACLEAA
jgi:hypothetical protein